MQNSKVCINEVAPNVVTVDVASAASLLLSTESGAGFVYRKTLEHLGLERVDGAEYDADMVFSGSVEDIRDNIPRLQRHIGVIARYGSEEGQYSLGMSQESIGRALGYLTGRTIPSLPENASLMRAVGVVTEPFADALSDDYTRVYYARKPHWKGDTLGVTDSEGIPLGPFSARDIGGLEVARDGLPAREMISYGVRVDQRTMHKLRLLHGAKGTRLADEFRSSLQAYVEMEGRPEVSPDSAPKTAPRVLINYPRTVLEKLITLEFPQDTKMTDVMYHALRLHLDASIADPELNEKVHAEALRLQEEAQKYYLLPPAIEPGLE